MIWIENHRLDDGGYPGLETEMSKVNSVQVGQIFIYKVPSCQNDAAPIKSSKTFVSHECNCCVCKMMGMILDFERNWARFGLVR